MVSFPSPVGVARVIGYLNAFALITGSAISYLLVGAFTLRGVLEYWGDILLLEVMLLFLAGGFASITHSKSWHETMRVLAYLRRQGPALPEEKEWNPEAQRMAERNALVYLAAGGIMILELVVLAVIWNITI